MTDTTTTPDPEAIALACLNAKLQDLGDLDQMDIGEIADSDGLPLPADDDDAGWDALPAAIRVLVDNIRKAYDIPAGGAA